jgi:hypothetical protein
LKILNHLINGPTKGTHQIIHHLWATRSGNVLENLACFGPKSSSLNNRPIKTLFEKAPARIQKNSQNQNSKP